MSQTGNERKRRKPRASYLTVAATTLATAAGMFLYEFTKEGLFPAFSKWQSHMMTICITSLLSAILTYYILKRREYYVATITEENARLYQANEKITSLLSEKELLLKEVHHRIKNNLNVVHSLLRLQAENAKDSLAIEAITEVAGRVQGMMQLYDKLYLSDDFDFISVAAYFPPLIDEIVAIFPARKGVKIEKKIEDFILPVKTIASLGLIINELITNAMKYAFIGRADGTLWVSVESEGTKARVTVEDDGNGIPDSVDGTHSTGIGLLLIQLQTKQIGGSLRIDRGKGARIIVEFDLADEPNPSDGTPFMS